MRSRHMSAQLTDSDTIGAFEQHKTCCATSRRFSCAATFDNEDFSFDGIQAGGRICTFHRRGRRGTYRSNEV